MTMVRKSFTLTQRNDEWLKAQLATGHFGNESEIIRELIRERAMREHSETPEEIAAIRKALEIGERSGVSTTDPKDLLAKFKSKAARESAV